jgi:hypothetical protein
LGPGVRRYRMVLQIGSESVAEAARKIWCDVSRCWEAGVGRANSIAVSVSMTESSMEPVSDFRRDTASTSSDR